MCIYNMNGFLVELLTVDFETEKLEDVPQQMCSVSQEMSMAWTRFPKRLYLISSAYPKQRIVEFAHTQHSR